MLNLVFIYPSMKNQFRSFYQLRPSITGSATHYVYMDIEVDGKDMG